MAINRAPWNALVDDDGSNLIGSVWNKDAIKTVLLDPIDAQHIPWTDVPHNAAAFSANVGAWTVTASEITYGISANGYMDYAVYVSASTTTGAATNLNVLIPLGRQCARNTIGVTYVVHPTAAFEIGNAFVGPGGTMIAIQRAGLAAFGVGTVNVYMTIRFPLL